jgi:hypothetical protein
MLMLGTLFALVAVAGSPNEVECARAGPAFMADYAEALTQGDRSGIARRYRAVGAYSLGFEAKTFDSLEAIARRYASKDWQKPDEFAWTDLSYEQIGPETCLVVGGFRWTSGGRTAQMAYTSVLRLEGGALRIMLEHENVLPKASGN